MRSSSTYWDTESRVHLVDFCSQGVCLMEAWDGQFGCFAFISEKKALVSCPFVQQWRVKEWPLGSLKSMETGTPRWKDRCCWKFNQFSRTFGHLSFLIPGKGYCSSFKDFVSLLRARLGLITIKARVDSLLGVTDRTASFPDLYAEALSPSGTVSGDGLYGGNRV